ncbi:MAG: hypothetical protein R3E39_21750 [Anaerolineae bacterium]
MTDLDSVRKIHEQCVALSRKKKYVQAAELIEPIAETLLTAHHPYHSYEVFWGICEQIGQGVERDHPQQAISLYQIAIRSFESIATGYISDTTEVLPHVERIQKRIKRLQG